MEIISRKAHLVATTYFLELAIIKYVDSTQFCRKEQATGKTTSHVWETPLLSKLSVNKVVQCGEVHTFNPFLNSHNFKARSEKPRWAQTSRVYYLILGLDTEKQEILAGIPQKTELNMGLPHHDQSSNAFFFFFS